MQEQGKKGNKISNKHVPKGLTIIYDDNDIMVVNKANGLLTIATNAEKEKTAHYLLNTYVKKGNSRSRNRVFIVHRLDRETSGILVFAKSEKSKLFLQENWKSFSKTYYAVVHGKLAQKKGVITSFLAENKMHRMYSTKDETQGKFSKTGYKIIRESRRLSMLEIALHTGRKNQIRVHLSDQGHPIVGDKVYGDDKGGKQLALHAAKLTIKHPVTKKEMTFETDMPLFLNSLVKA